jgi:hypothetical protein
MSKIVRPLVRSYMLGLKSLQIEVLGENRAVLSRATGFVVSERDGMFLYTCWHVVTGIDFLQPTPLRPPARRASLTVSSQDVAQCQPGVQAFGGGRKIEIPLYDATGAPRWLQEPDERVLPDMNAIGFHVPASFDIVRIPIDLDPLIREAVEFVNDDIYSNSWEAGRDVMIVGYPHGYSAIDTTTPEPIFLKRSIASNRTAKISTVLLDGGGTPGMSGAPVIVFHEGRWWLIGIYTGLIFPDHQRGSEGQGNDRHAALGSMAPVYFARASMRVPGIFEP